MNSVIIPTYRPDIYIYECLYSLNSQTIDKEDFEVLVILNGPKEPYYNQLSAFLVDKSNMYLYYTDKKGVSNARNVGLEKAKGDYISFIDDDDIVSENYLECLSAKVSCDSIVVSNVFNFIHDKNEKIIDYLTIKNESSGIFRNRCYLSNACCKLIPRSLIANRRFDENFVKGEDAIFMFCISDKIRSIRKADIDCVYYRRLREMSASRKETPLIDRLNTAMEQQLAYSCIYIKKPFKYNFFLFISRMIAVLKIFYISCLKSI